MADDVVPPARSLFEALAESAPDAIVTIDASSTILSANQAVRRIFGHAPEEIVGRPLNVLMPESLRERHRQGLERYLAHGTRHIPWTGTRLTGLHKDGSAVPIEVSFGEFVDEAGRRIFSGFIRDISGHLQQQRTLDSAREDLALQTQLLAAVEQAVISTDPSGKILSWNAHAERLYGWSAEEAIGRNLRDLLDPVHEFEDDRPIEQLREGDKVSYHRRVRRRDGKSIWVSVVAAPLKDSAGNVTRLVGTSVDITERHALEAQLRQALRLDAVGRLASGVAHDFNNVLTVILANAELVALGLDPASESRADVDEIVKAAERGAALTRQLLTFSKREPSAMRPVDVNAVISDLEKMLRRLIAADVEIRLRLRQLPRVLGDVGKLEQVVTNLVVNARDAMPGGGRVTIETERCETVKSRATASGVMPAGSYAKISVCDTGHGMSESVRARIFEPFFTTKTAEKGTGLGLATAYAIVAQCGGFIEVDSELGKGSTFSIYLPAS